MCVCVCVCVCVCFHQSPMAEGIRKIKRDFSNNWRGFLFFLHL